MESGTLERWSLLTPPDLRNAVRKGREREKKRERSIPMRSSRSPIDVESEPGKLVVESQVDMKYLLLRETKGEKSENEIGRKRRPLSFLPPLVPSGNIKIPYTGDSLSLFFLFFFL